MRISSGDARRVSSTRSTCFSRQLEGCASGACSQAGSGPDRMRSMAEKLPPGRRQSSWPVVPCCLTLATPRRPAGPAHIYTAHCPLLSQCGQLRPDPPVKAMGRATSVRRVRTERSPMRVIAPVPRIERSRPVSSSRRSGQRCELPRAGTDMPARRHHHRHGTPVSGWCDGAVQGGPRVLPCAIVWSRVPGRGNSSPW